MNGWSDMTYVVLGWLVFAGVMIAFAATTLVQGRRLSRRVPPERRRWM